MRRPACLLLLIGLWHSGFAQAGDAGLDPMPPPEAVTSREAVEVRRVHRPVVIEPRSGKARRSGRCAPARPEDLIVTEDGSPVLVTAVDGSTLDVLHVILLDTSSSMRKRIERTKQTANRYLATLPPGEPAIVASFDDSLVLHSPPQADRTALRRAVNGLQVGHNTALWTSLHYIIDYLAALPAHKVVILLSDGDDSTSMPRHTVELLLEQTTALHDLTLFAIGLDLSTEHRSGLRSPVALLRALARRTGGEFYDVEQVAGLDRVFQRIRRRLEHKYYVSYVPKPFGRGPLDEPQRFDSRLRVVEVRMKDGVPCHVSSLAHHTRLEGRPVPSLDTSSRSSDERPRPGRLERCDELPARWSVERALSLRTADSERRGASDVRPWLFRVRDHDLWVGRVDDIAVDAGVIYDRTIFGRTGRLRLGLQELPVRSVRDVLLRVPGFDRVRETIRRPEDVLLELLRRPPCGSSGGPAGRIEDPLWINGRTLLEIRQLLGVAMRHSSPDYRRWAAERIRALSWAQFRGVLAEQDRAGRTDEAVLAEIRRMVEARAAAPSSDVPQLFLAEWLGDVPARSLAMRLQTIGADAWLHPGDEAETAQRVLEGWERLRGWFPAPTHVRVVAPLVPAWDPEREVFGFYRVLLPRPLDSGSAANLVPEAPLGLRLARWLFERGVALPSELRVVDVAQTGLPAPSGGPALAEDADGRQTEVRLLLGDDPHRAAGPELLARFARDPAAPRCVEVVDGRATVPDPRLALIRDRLRASGIASCSSAEPRSGRPRAQPTADPSGG